SYLAPQTSSSETWPPPSAGASSLSSGFPDSRPLTCEEVADHPREPIRCERLLQQDRSRIEHAVMDDRVVGVARHVEDLQSRAALNQTIGETTSAHRRHA